MKQNAECLRYFKFYCLCFKILELSTTVLNMDMKMTGNEGTHNTTCRKFPFTSCCFSLIAEVKSILDSHILFSVCWRYFDIMSSSARLWSSRAARSSPFSRWTSRINRDSLSMLAISAPLGLSLDASFSVSTSSLY